MDFSTEFAKYHKKSWKFCRSLENVSNFVQPKRQATECFRQFNQFIIAGRYEMQ